MLEKKSLRVAYGQTLKRLGDERRDIVVLEADLSKSTMGAIFAVSHSDRFYEMGIAEANMASVAAGLSLTGLVPFMGSFAVFSTGRCYDQIRNGICVPMLNVKICGSSAGMSDYGDGASHQSVEDMAIMRVLPNMEVYCPCDALQVEKIVGYMAEHPGPMYIRICRNDLPILTDETWEFLPGKVRTLREGRDVAIFSCGAMVSAALKAAEELERRGIEASVIDVPSIKPLQEEEVARIAERHRAIVTAEEHSVIGGLGDAIAACIEPRLKACMGRVGIMDRFGASAENYYVLLEAYGLTSMHIAETAEKIFRRCKQSM